MPADSITEICPTPARGIPGPAGMATRRSNGEGGLSWNEARQRWVGPGLAWIQRYGQAVASAPGSARGPRPRRCTNCVPWCETTTTALPTHHAYTVGEAVEGPGWKHGLVGVDPNTVANRTSLVRTHVITGGLGQSVGLQELTAEEIDEWLAVKAKSLSTDTLQRLLSILRQSIRRAQARDLVKRNVALLCDLPKGQPGRAVQSH